MEHTRFSWYAPAHIVHPSKKGITTTQMLRGKYVQCSALMIAYHVDVSDSASDAVGVHYLPVKIVCHCERRLWILQNSRYTVQLIYA